ncbi:MAG TPA: hypothetical protein VEQ85_16280, partial [Lacipirellulaceae bacterium]|nr:hypothetical protein [Lacipirellulaceae bacterium]
DSCLRQPALGKIETALAEVCGGRVPLVLATHEDPEGGAPAAARPTLKQQQSETAAQPFVKRALELFDGDGSRLRIVPPRDS